MMCVRMRVKECVCARARACVRVRACVRMRACVRVRLASDWTKWMWSKFGGCTHTVLKFVCITIGHRLLKPVTDIAYERAHKRSHADCNVLYRCEHLHDHGKAFTKKIQTFVENAEQLAVDAGHDNAAHPCSS